ncbi:MAG TPA: hypothetical protein VN954_01520 [Ktedonobacteraceae bacterium]|nr:hypothetical protein [Ktedonobacteraceae bacterium]
MKLEAPDLFIGTVRAWMTDQLLPQELMAGERQSERRQSWTRSHQADWSFPVAPNSM